MSENHRGPEVPEVKVPVVECRDALARIISKELATTRSAKSGILQNACSTSPKMDASLVKSALMHTVRLMNSLAQGLQNNGDKSAVAMLEITRQMGCVFQDMEPPKSTTILRKSSNVLKPIRCVRFTEAVLCHANIRDRNPSFGITCPGGPHQRKPKAPIFEDRSQEEAEWQERCAREAGWRLAKNILK